MIGTRDKLLLNMSIADFSFPFHQTASFPTNAQTSEKELSSSTYSCLMALTNQDCSYSFTIPLIRKPLNNFLSMMYWSPPSSTFDGERQGQIYFVGFTLQEWRALRTGTSVKMLCTGSLEKQSQALKEPRL